MHGKGRTACLCAQKGSFEQVQTGIDVLRGGRGKFRREENGAVFGIGRENDFVLSVKEQRHASASNLRGAIPIFSANSRMTSLNCIPYLHVC